MKRVDRRPMRIAQLTSRFPKLSETFILLETLELERLGFRVDVYALVRERAPVQHPEAARLAAAAHYGLPPRPRHLASQLRWLRRAPRRLLAAWAGAARGNLRSPGFLLRALAIVPVAAAWAEEMERDGVERVHAHYATHPALAAWVIHRLTGLPYTFTAHAHDLYVDRAMLEAKIDGADHVVTISDFNRRLLGELAPGREGKLVVVRSGVEPERFAGEPPRPGAGPVRVLAIGSLEPYKGHAYLVRAIAALRDRGLDVVCRIVGEGPERPALEALAAELGVAGAVALPGGLPRARVLAELEAADVVAMPSVVTPEGKMEGLPVTLMEALAAARPVVATAISGIPELVEDEVTGLLVPPRDAAALAAAISRLVADPALGRRLAEAGRARVRAEYDLRVNVAELAEVIAA